MKRMLMGLLIAGSLAELAQANDIQIYLNSRSVVIDPPTAQEQDFSFDQTTGLNTPTAYSVFAANGGEDLSTDTATVSLGTLHSYSYSTAPLDGTVSYSEGYVDIFTDDRGVVPAGVTSLLDWYSLTGTTSAIASSGPYEVEAVVYENLIDLDNGDSSTNTARAFFDLQNPAADVNGVPLTVKPGDRVEHAVVFEINTYQAGNASQSAAFVDYSHTLNLYIDTGVPGVDFVSSSGHDYASPDAAAPEPGTWESMAMGAFLLAMAFVRRSRVGSPLPQSNSRSF